jgi:Ca-activated chloride channel family protein
MKEFYAGYSKKRFFIRNASYLIAFCLGVLALTSPYTKESFVSIPRPVKDVVIALDISLSMNARDIFPSRFEAARNELLQILKVPNLRTSLLLFSGKTLVTLPLTQDQQVLSMFAREINPGFIKTEGTDYYELFVKIIDEYDHTLSLAKELGWEASKVPMHVIILTDGDGLKWPDESLLYEIQKRDIVLWVESFGSVEGAGVPLYNEDGSFQEYLSINGQTYSSKNQEEELEKWVHSTMGYYVSYSAKTRLSERVLQIDDNSGTSVVFQDYLAIKNALFPYLVMISILFLILAMIL